MILKHRKYLIKFVNLIRESEYESISEIPEEIYSFVKDYDYLTIVTPFVLHDMRNGMSINQLKIKYSIGYATVRTIGRRAGLYSCQGITQEHIKSF